ncbi:cysteine--1-D-myo-inosityl 2-amino-2-deoxy-alpha-D-glucopyranoside ligase [Lysinibacter cavernae]|uniref:L-cysteine:1D-myo-inositol 2-amino-2-deoxy-alpha-D-glucopyranoside ligase n=1 Tax=Lysinibacter cavernae TaxID=1640652 RepID=A0A7X5TST4_9MICO|nr:L-cysteine:1D-myo-inositol 2-amino-2-deoxy-alpha-D-glucopyranoside ligase [Lysinibacter cavernae]
MQSWSAPVVPVLPGSGLVPVIFDTSTQRLVPSTDEPAVATLYVCGITPYDATHIGHAATYLAYDLLLRAWRDAGLETRYGQNITDIDDPLLERADATGVNWEDLAAEQIDLFREDMAALSMLPPDAYVGVTEQIDAIADGVKRLEDSGFAYRVAVEGTQGDLYFDSHETLTPGWTVGSTTPYDRPELDELSAERGGDPLRDGKRDPIDPLLWRAERAGEPAWDSPVGRGRPGWHIECSVIAVDALGSNISVQGGGYDLVFPHHDFSAGHALALNGQPLAKVFNHVALVAYEGEKMSKSRGNLVFVSKLRRSGVHPSVIRLAIMASHYRTAWEWTDARLGEATDRFALWMRAFSPSADGQGANGPAVDAGQLLNNIRVSLANDLDAASAIGAIDAAAHQALAGGVDDVALVRSSIMALLGVDLADTSNLAPAA